jgi:hypothetical protein
MVATMGLSITVAGFAWVDMTIKEALVVNLLSAFSVIVTTYFWIKVERTRKEIEEIRKEINRLIEELHEIMRQDK